MSGNSAAAAAAVAEKAAAAARAAEIAAKAASYCRSHSPALQVPDANAESIAAKAKPSKPVEPLLPIKSKAPSPCVSAPQQDSRPQSQEKAPWRRGRQGKPNPTSDGADTGDVDEATLWKAEDFPTLGGNTNSPRSLSRRRRSKSDLNAELRGLATPLRSRHTSETCRSIKWAKRGSASHGSQQQHQQHWREDDEQRRSFTKSPGHHRDRGTSQKVNENKFAQAQAYRHHSEPPQAPYVSEQRSFRFAGMQAAEASRTRQEITLITHRILENVEKVASSRPDASFVAAFTAEHAKLLQLTQSLQPSGQHGDASADLAATVALNLLLSATQANPVKKATPSLGHCQSTPAMMPIAENSRRMQVAIPSPMVSQITTPTPTATSTCSTPAMMPIAENSSRMRVAIPSPMVSQITTPTPTVLMQGMGNAAGMYTPTWGEASQMIDDSNYLPGAWSLNASRRSSSQQSRAPSSDARPYIPGVWRSSSVSRADRPVRSRKYAVVNPRTGERLVISSAVPFRWRHPRRLRILDPRTGREVLPLGPGEEDDARDARSASRDAWRGVARASIASSRASIASTASGGRRASTSSVGPRCRNSIVGRAVKQGCDWALEPATGGHWDWPLSRQEKKDRILMLSQLELLAEIEDLQNASTSAC